MNEVEHPSSFLQDQIMMVDSMYYRVSDIAFYTLCYYFIMKYRHSDKIVDETQMTKPPEPTRHHNFI